MACKPSDASVTTKPASPRSSSATCWFISLSSTRRTRAPRMGRTSSVGSLIGRAALPSLSLRPNAFMIASCRVDWLMGFTRNTFRPMRRPAWYTSSSSKAVVMIIVTVSEWPGNSLISLLAARPSIPGIRQSMSTTAKGFPATPALSTALTASGPDGAERTENPRCSN